ncbi:MAG: phage major capsid protein [Actinobacteria bacterium]|nr:phage major capsid protein [Actinomycetota bacterium]
MEPNEVKSALEGIQTKLSEKVAERDAEIKSIGQATEETAKEISRISKEYEEARQELKGSIESVREDILAKMESARASGPAKFRSLGEAFVNSPEYLQHKSENFHKNSSPFEVGSSLHTKTTFTAASLGDTAAYMFGVDRLPEIVSEPDRLQFVRDLLPTYGVETGAVEFVREDTFTNNAGMVPEYVATDSENKPESAISFEIVTVPVRTMAHWIPMTRQSVADIRQIRSYVDNRLLHGLRLKEDQQILYGTGTGNEINGILTDGSIQSVTGVGGAETVIDLVRKAVTKSYVAEYRPTGVIMNHEDWEDVELVKGSDEHYIWVNVTTQNGSRLWGLPVVVTNAITQGTFLLGDFQRGSAIHDRENATLRLSDSHADFFTKNLLALLAEERIAQSIYRPNAFVEGTLYS